MNQYTFEDWKNRMATRDDMSTSLVHLTRKTDEFNAVEVLIKILSEQKLIGSGKEGFIQGNEKVVCFQDAPLTGIAQNILLDQNMKKEGKTNKLRYNAAGLIFTKPYVFRKGGRPVIYETKENANELFQNVKWRVVTLDLNDDSFFIDWTHEREWRVKGDFNFELSEVSIILPNSKAYNYFIENVDPDILKGIKGIVNLGLVI